MSPISLGVCRPWNMPAVVSTLLWRDMSTSSHLYAPLCALATSHALLSDGPRAEEAALSISPVCCVCRARAAPGALRGVRECFSNPPQNSNLRHDFFSSLPFFFAFPLEQEHTTVGQALRAASALQHPIGGSFCRCTETSVSASDKFRLPQLPLTVRCFSPFLHASERVVPGHESPRSEIRKVLFRQGRGGRTDERSQQGPCVVEAETLQPRRSLQHQQHEHEHHQHQLKHQAQAARFAVVRQPSPVRRPGNRGRRRGGSSVRVNSSTTFRDAAEATTARRRKAALDARQPRRDSGTVSRGRRRPRQHELQQRLLHDHLGCTVTAPSAGVQQRLHRAPAPAAGRPSRILVGQAEVPQAGSNGFRE